MVSLLKIQSCIRAWECLEQSLCPSPLLCAACVQMHSSTLGYPR